MSTSDGRSRLLRWSQREGAWVEERGDAGGPLLVADSWLLVDGRVRGLGLHWERFSDACSELGHPLPPALRDATIAALPRRGTWFPRLELALPRALPAPARRGPVLRLRLRADPRVAPGVPVACWVDPEPDPREAPRRKGPDLARLAHRNAAAARHGASEALLLDERGHAIEGAFSSLVWWEGDTLAVVDDEAPILAGVTRRLVLGLAHRQSVPVRRTRRRPRELLAHELWIVNALHGIRPVAAVLPHGDAAPAPRAVRWQAKLEGLAELV